ncbi:siderophore-interacting protein [Microbacterium sp. CFBP 13617]|uniref:siderophore-interacting protein n=1 Tax=Microbacterium sp. CFBP 13617 TaxID=2774035 RepID=UPI00177DEFD0|nr:siderophore-interacting protein [Microbacterium sp. CFBP 13617]MBD8218577.1 siderophore-interacting protein [Microbacterium sp. CFBP 13617]
MTEPDDRPAFAGTVTAVARVTPHMVRVVIGEVHSLDGQGLDAAQHPDEFFGLWVPGPDALPLKRYYTVRERRPETGELVVDLLLHGHGPATEWAARAAVGDTVLFEAPRGHYAPPADTTRILLCGDATALPAIGRILDERALTGAGGPPVTVVIALDDPTDRQELTVRPGDDVRWCAPGDLVAETRRLSADDPDAYVWFSGEASDMRTVRTTLRRERRIPPHRWMTMGYWRRDSERWIARFEAAGPGLRDAIEEVFSSEADDEEQTDRFEDLLAEKGLL